MSTHLIITVAAVAAFSLVLGACHHGRRHQAGPDSAHALRHLNTQLDLDATQRQQVAAILGDVESLGKEGDHMRKAMEEYARRAIATDSSDPAAADRFVSAQAAKAVEISRRFAASVAEIKEVLNDAQEEKLIVLLEKHAARGHRH